MYSHCQIIISTGSEPRNISSVGKQSAVADEAWAIAEILLGIINFQTSGMFIDSISVDCKAHIPDNQGFVRDWQLLLSFFFL